MDNLRIIITGGPGTGKTSLIEALKTMGYQVFPEVSRQLIASGMEAPIRMKQPGGKEFLNQILASRKMQYEAWNGKEPAFYDRGLPDSLAFFMFMGFQIPENVKDIILTHPYNPNVLILTPWPEIYHTDEVRSESFEEMIRIHKFIEEVYLELGYKLYKVPKGSLTDRANWIIKFCHLSDLP